MILRELGWKRQWATGTHAREGPRDGSAAALRKCVEHEDQKRTILVDHNSRWLNRIVGRMGLSIRPK